MSQMSQLADFAAAVGGDIKSVREGLAAVPAPVDAYTKAEIGDITTDLVAAYNAAKA